MLSCTKKVVFKCNIETLWTIVTNNEDFSWRSDLSKIVIVDENHFMEYTTKGYPSYFSITSKEFLKEYKFMVENTNLKGFWHADFSESPYGVTTMNFTEEIDVFNPIMKFLARFYLNSMQKRYIRDLSSKVTINTNINM